ncbi:hypothetical protein [Streptomyces sp. enrichment culture]
MRPDPASSGAARDDLQRVADRALAGRPAAWDTGPGPLGRRA